MCEEMIHHHQLIFLSFFLRHTIGALEHMGIHSLLMNTSDSLILSSLVKTQFKASNRTLSLVHSLVFFYSVCLKLIDTHSSGIAVAIASVCLQNRHDLIRLIDRFRHRLVMSNDLFPEFDLLSSRCEYVDA